MQVTVAKWKGRKLSKTPPNKRTDRQQRTPDNKQEQSSTDFEEQSGGLV